MTATRIHDSRPLESARRSRGAVVVGLLGISAFAASLVQTLVVPLLPRFPELLGVSETTTPWLVTATLLAGSICTPLLAQLGDRFGRRRLMLVALGSLVTGSVVCALSANVVGLLVGRSLQGAAMAVVPLGISVAHSVPLGRRPSSAVGIISAMMGVGGAVGLPAAGLVIEFLDYRVLFWATAITAAVASVGVLLVVPPVPGRGSGKADVLGTCLFAALLTALLLPLSEGGRWGWTSPATLALAAGFLTLIPVFVWVERRHPDPAVDVLALTHKPIRLANLAAVFMGFAMFENFVTTMQLAQVPQTSGYGFGLSAFAASLCMLPGGVVMVVSAPATRRLIDRHGPKITMLLGLTVLLLGTVTRLIGSNVLGLVVASSAIVGVGTALSFAAMPTLVLLATPSEHGAAATGLNALSRIIGLTFASAGSGVVLSSLTVLVDGESQPTELAFSLLSAGAVASALCAAALVVLIPSRPAGTASGTVRPQVPTQL